MKLTYKGNELSVKCPELIEEWDFEANYPLTPDDVTYGSAKKIQWICKKCGYKWLAAPNKRSQGRGCPECAKINRGKTQKKTYAKRNNFAEQYPALAEEWDYSQNDSLPSDFSVHSNAVVWWICHKCKHKWETSINNRTGKNGTNCPNCAYKSNGENTSLNAAKANSFIEKHPELECEWDYEKNNGLSIENFSEKSNKKVWWKCSYCEHEWEASFNKRSSGQCCPACSPASTSFSEQAIFYYVSMLYEDALLRHKIDGFEFDIYIPAINVAIEYDGVFYHNNKKALKKENIKDEYCEGKGIKLIRFRDPKLCDTKSAERITCRDTQDNDFENGINELFNILGANNKPDINLLRDKPVIIQKFRLKARQESIAEKYPELLKEWDYEKNVNINPERVSCGSDIKVYWKCQNCGCSWVTSPYHRTGRKSGCPVCKGGAVFPGVNDLKTINPKLASEWDYEKNESLKPDMFRPGSNKSVFWICPDCGNSWEARIDSRSKGSGCPKCGGKRGSEKNIRNAAEKSNIESDYPELLKDWDYSKNSRSPNSLSPGSNKKVWWKCHKCGHEWEVSPNRRAKRHSGCPVCAGKVAMAGFNDLQTTHPELAKQWDYDKNELLPSQITKGSNKKVWWVCENGHEWQMMIHSRNSSRCPICVRENKGKK